MVPSERTSRLVSLCLACSLLAASPLSAGAHQLRGIVYGDSAPLAGAAVSLVDAATRVPSGSTTTGGGGAYLLTVADGRYDLLVAAARYEPAVVKGIEVAGADAVQDVALMSRPSLTGVLTTREGVPVAGASVVLLGTGDNGNGLYQGPPVRTDAAGRYLIDPSPTGRFILSVWNAAETSPLLPTDWRFDLGEFDVGGPTARDVVLPPVATLSGRVVAADGSPVPATVFGLGQHFWAGNASWRIWVRSRGEADAAGVYAVRGFAVGASDLSVTPPAASGFSVVNDRIDLSADGHRDFTLARPSLSGVVRTSAGAPVAGAEVLITGAGNLDYQQTLAGPVPTDAEGRYSFAQVPAGRAFLEIRSAGVAVPLLPPTWRAVNQDFEVLESGTRDVTLPPVAKLSGAATAGGAPVAGVGVTLSQVVYCPPWWVVAKGPAPPTGVDGAYEVRAFAVGRLELVVTPPEPSGLSTVYALRDDFWGDRRLDFALSRIVLSGVLRTAAGAPVPGAQVAVIGAVADTSFSNLTEPVTTDDEGRWVIDRAPGGVAYLDFRNPDDRTGLLPENWRAVQLNYGVTATATRNVNLPPVATLRGKTTDANGVPVGGVEVALDKAAWEVPWFISTRSGSPSDAAGGFAARAFALGRTTLTVRPPHLSGFNTGSPIGFSLTADRLLNVVLDRDDLAAPIILLGPVVAKVTDATAEVAWSTDEPARGGLRFGVAEPPATRLDEEPFATAHSMTIDGLAPDTVYFVAVFATDVAGNGPVESGVISFRTLAAPDTTAPAFTAGPIVSGVAHDAAVVEWATDEACAGLIRYGSAGNPALAREDPAVAAAHRVTLEGLEPVTAYTLTVECSDAAGNVATSSEIPFTTAPAPDATAPVIVEGPLVVDVTDTTATVEWTTDEPATSGVSWNDGTRHGLVTDPALVTAHRVTLAGLAPATAYALTVSSTDGAGNGPTLGGPVAFTTKVAPDTRPPVIVDGPTVVNRTHQSAVIRWQTDEPADGVVEYGLAAGALTLRDAHATLTRPHTQTLTGLASGTDYCFRVCSTDAAGNAACSCVLSFRTDDCADGELPVVSGLAVSYLADRTAAVSWTTSAPADSLAQYQTAGGPVRQVAAGAKVLQHQVILTGLEPLTRYAVRVGGADERGLPVVAPAPTSRARAAAAAAGTLAPQLTLTTAALADATPPAIVEGPAVVDLGPRRAVVRWVTDEIADTVVRYGRQGAGFGEQAAAVARTTEHRVTLTNLRPGATYAAVVRSADPAGNGPTESAAIAFTTLPPEPLFAEDFADATAAGDPQWLVAAGAWSGDAGTWVSARGASDLTTIAQFDPLTNPLAAGVVQVKVKLTREFRNNANGSVVFAYLDPARYRYARVVKGMVVIGQQGVVGGVAGGVKKRLAAAFAVGRAKLLTLEIRPDGRVRAFAGAKLVGSHQFPSSVAGGVGLAAARAKTVFDDVVVWDESGLGD